jgi:hypothetical protein
VLNSGKKIYGSSDSLYAWWCKNKKRFENNKGYVCSSENLKNEF